jgi:SacI restriction endonuclease
MSAEQILQHTYERAVETLADSVIQDETIRGRVDYVCKCLTNRAGIRLLMEALLGKLDNPKVDPRKPYTEIGGTDSFSGRTYDEQFLTRFISTYRLPCNPTTAFLTPAFRNIDRALTTDLQIVGRPRKLYVETINLLEDVYQNRVDAEALLVETVRVLVNMRDEKLARIDALLNTLRTGEGALPLSSEAIVGLIQQHLASKNSSRLPVLIVTAAYRSAEARLGERALPLRAHNAADLQTGALGDVEICLVGDDNVITVYEMKDKRVTVNDIDVAVSKISDYRNRINNYIFITTKSLSEK